MSRSYLGTSGVLVSSKFRRISKKVPDRWTCESRSWNAEVEIHHRDYPSKGFSLPECISIFGQKTRLFWMIRRFYPGPFCWDIAWILWDRLRCSLGPMQSPSSCLLSGNEEDSTAGRTNEWKKKRKRTIPRNPEIQIFAPNGPCSPTFGKNTAGTFVSHAWPRHLAFHAYDDSHFTENS